MLETLWEAPLIAFTKKKSTLVPIFEGAILGQFEKTVEQKTKGAFSEGLDIRNQIWW